jgi:cobalamin biosynthesis protein CbiG
MATEDSAKEAARKAIYEAIPGMIQELKDGSGPHDQALGLKNLAEAFAWASAQSQPH